MNSNRYHILLFILIIAANISIIRAQDNPGAMKTLIRIEDAFNSGNVDQLAEYIDSKTYFSFTSDLTGYFSYSQIYNLLKDYFEAYKPIKFGFASKSSKTNSPFGWGEYIFLRNGLRGSHKIFISLQSSDSKFYISQISIN
ncbi:hypothetical protein ASZ90_005203 [hydrocarbon metagenome]|uniref:DUF4783 domain-containing protein n=1 Tax=hydrocarbon metagenome TaxID=938273 RepID=A0A0W8FW01_9ZZZZ